MVGPIVNLFSIWWSVAYPIVCIYPLCYTLYVTVCFTFQFPQQTHRTPTGAYHSDSFMRVADLGELVARTDTDTERPPLEERSVAEGPGVVVQRLPGGR